jgi:hypothetical protein
MTAPAAVAGTQAIVPRMRELQLMGRMETIQERILRHPQHQTMRIMQLTPV